eukprot:scaffold89152_cov42-Cyclotella_meneghiniana.AAC.1
MPPNPRNGRMARADVAPLMKYDRIDTYHDNLFWPNSVIEMGSLVEVIQKSTRLHHLTFNIPTNLNPTFRYNRDICDAIAGNVSIKTVGLDCYKITENEDKLLADMIRENKTIVSLTIVSDAGFTHITDAFKVNQGIRKIVLAGNFPKFFGLMDIADFLKVNTTLRNSL